MQATDGNLYGVTLAGGSGNLGTAFKITPSGTLTTLHNFCSQSNCADGALPTSLLQGRDGSFYGVAGSYVSYGYDGTVFKMKPDGTAVRHWFG